MAIICVNDYIGIGKTCRKENPFTVVKGIMLAVPGFQFASFSSFATNADYLTAIAAGNLFPVQLIKEVEPQDVEDGIYESPTGEKSLMYEGIRGYSLKVKTTLEQHKALRSYSGGNWRIFKIDGNNNIMGTTPDGTAVEGFELGYIHVGRMMQATPDSPAFTPITIQEANVEEWDTNGIYVDPTWLASSLHGVVRCSLSCSTVALNIFTATVNYSDDSGLDSDGTAYTAAISGLVVGNFEIFDQTGALMDSASDYTVTETAVAGVYTINCTAGGLTAGTCQLVASSTLLYDSTVQTLSA